MDRRREQKWFRILAAAALFIFLAVALFFSVGAYAMRSEDFRHASGAKALGMRIKAHASEHGKFPFLISEPGRLMFETDWLDFDDDSLHVLISHADPAMEQASSKDAQFFIDHCSYYYLGYEVWNDESVLTFADAYKNRIAEGLPFDSDLAADGPMQRVKRLTNNEVATSVPDSEVPLLIERPGHTPAHLGYGSAVRLFR